MTEQINTGELNKIWSSLGQALDAVSLTAWVYDLCSREYRILFGGLCEDNGSHMCCQS